MAKKKKEEENGLIDKKELVSILDMLRPGLAKKEVLEQLTHFGFTGEEIVTYNDFISIVHPFQTEFKCSVPADEFYKIVKNMPDGGIKMELKDGRMLLTAGKTKGSIKTQDGEDISKNLKEIGFRNKKKEWFYLPKGFMKGLQFCLFSASTDMTSPLLTGILFDKDSMMSTDDLRCSRFFLDEQFKNMDEKDQNVRFLIPGRSGQELLAFSDVDQFSRSGYWGFFENKNGVTFCTTLLEDDGYPDIDELMDFDGINVKFPEKIREAIDLVLVMAEGDTDAERLIEVEITSKTIRCKGENDRGWVSREFDVDLDLDRTIAFQINPAFWLEIISHTKEMIYIEGRAKFETGEFVHVMSIK